MLDYQAIQWNGDNQHEFEATGATPIVLGGGRLIVHNVSIDVGDCLFRTLPRGEWRVISEAEYNAIRDAQVNEQRVNLGMRRG